MVDHSAQSGSVGTDGHGLAPVIPQHSLQGGKIPPLHFCQRFPVPPLIAEIRSKYDLPSAVTRNFRSPDQPLSMGTRWVMQS